MASETAKNAMSRLMFIHRAISHVCDQGAGTIYALCRSGYPCETMQGLEIIDAAMAAEETSDDDE